MVRSFCGILKLKLDLTLISLQGVYTNPKVSPHSLKTESYSLLLRIKLVANPAQFCLWTRFDSSSLFSFSKGFPPFQCWVTHIPSHLEGQSSAAKGVYLEKSNQWEVKAARHVSWSLLDGRKWTLLYGWPIAFQLAFWLFKLKYELITM